MSALYVYLCYLKTRLCGRMSVFLYHYMDAIRYNTIRVTAERMSFIHAFTHTWQQRLGREAPETDVSCLNAGSRIHHSVDWTVLCNRPGVSRGPEKDGVRDHL